MGRRQLLAGEEEPFQFVEKLAGGQDPRHIGLPWPGLRPAKDEIAIDDRWQIRVAAPRSPQVDTAVNDLIVFFSGKMSLRPAKVTFTPTAPAGAANDPPHARQGPARRADRAGRLSLLGRRRRGADPWQRRLRRAPRRVVFGRPANAPRRTAAAARRPHPRAPLPPAGDLCGLGRGGRALAPAEIYTDAHLRLISHYGYDAIWLNWYPGPERGQPLPTAIPPGQVAQGTTYQPFTPRLHDLFDSAERFGLEVAILYAAPHPANDAERKVVEDEARRFVREFPKIRTIILLDEGMGSRYHQLGGWLQTCSWLAAGFRRRAPTSAWWPGGIRSPAPTADRSVWDQIMQQFWTCTRQPWWRVCSSGKLSRSPRRRSELLVPRHAS